jgi:hypothetical protein
LRIVKPLRFSASAYFHWNSGTNDIQQRKLLILNAFHASTQKGTAWNNWNKKGENA